ncbi:MAG: transporter [Actinobacteria bacterium]|nr:transporter [Actinomycetota bacterium]
MIWIVLTMIAAAGAGGVFAHNKPHPAERTAKRLMDLVLWVLIPPVLFFNLVHFELTAEVGGALAFAVAANVLVAITAWLVGSRVLRLGRPATGAMIVCSLLGNTAYLGYPVVTAAEGFDALGTAVSYDILISVPFLLIVGFSVGAAFGTVAEGTRDRVKSYFTRNPLIWATVAALLAPDSLSPDWAVDASRVLVFAILPLGFFAVGIVMLRESEDDHLGFPPKLTAPVVATVVMRLGVAAGFLLLIDKTVFEIPDVYLIQAAMPVGVNNLLLANNYGLDRKLAAGAIVWSTMIVAVAGLILEFV